jgi:hypothetical protein
VNIVYSSLILITLNYDCLEVPERYPWVLAAQAKDS